MKRRSARFKIGTRRKKKYPVDADDGSQGKGEEGKAYEAKSEKVAAPVRGKVYKAKSGKGDHTSTKQKHKGGRALRSDR